MCSVNVLLVISIIGISAGVMAGLMFGGEYHNWSTCTMAFISAIFASYVSYLHLAYKKNWMVTWEPAKYKLGFWIGLLVFIASFLGMIGCLIAAGIKKQGLTHDELMGENLWMTAVWCFMTAKWSSQTAVFSRRYSSAVMRPLTKTSPIHSTVQLY
ncbi:unnamed protein product, partial [Mesorhabditis belari]|uniref:Heme transporter hrg-1 n=1 Tax=Mesorhabditis belari TaxID=2138241 RepID=A0AAF3FKL8_9BILA